MLPNIVHKSMKTNLNIICVSSANLHQYVTSHCFCSTACIVTLFVACLCLTLSVHVFENNTSLQSCSTVHSRAKHPSNSLAYQQYDTLLHFILNTYTSKYNTCYPIYGSVHITIERHTICKMCTHPKSMQAIVFLTW